MQYRFTQTILHSLNNSINKENIESWLMGIDESNPLIPDNIRAQWVAEKQNTYHPR